MTQKEKAEQLVLKMLRIHNNVDWFHKELAKQCALIAVDEIIREYGTYYKVEVEGKYLSYWEEVKQEIKKL